MLTQLLEKLKRPGLLGLIGRRVEKRCQAHLYTYFQALGRRIVGVNLEQLADLADQHVNAEMLARHSVELKLGNTLRVFTPLLKSVLEINIQDALMAANKIHHLAEADDSSDDDTPDAPDVPPYVPTTTSEEAALYASIRAGELVSGINSTTQIRIADAVAEGITDRLGVDGTKRLIQATLTDMSSLRARMIASTEMNNAFSEATMRKLDRMGVEYKRWITSADACPICQENEDASPIPIEDLFPSGDERPGAHPNCRCALSGARPPA